MNRKTDIGRLTGQLADEYPVVRQQSRNDLVEHKQYINKHGENMPEVRNWKWSTQ